MPYCQGSLLWAFSAVVLTVIAIPNDRMAPPDLVNDSDFYRHLIIDDDFGLGAFDSNHKIAWNLYLETLCCFLLVR